MDQLTPHTSDEPAPLLDLQPRTGPVFPPFVL